MRTLPVPWAPASPPATSCGYQPRTGSRNLRTISLLSFLGKVFDKVLTQRIARAGAETEAISKEHRGSRANLTTIDTLMTTLNSAQGWLVQKSKPNKLSTGPGPDRSSVMGNDIDGSFNCVRHSRLTDIMDHYQLPNNVTRTIASFTADRMISMSFDDQTEPAAAFNCRLLQRSPLSPVLFILYASALTKGQQFPPSVYHQLCGQQGHALRGEDNQFRNTDPPETPQKQDGEGKLLNILFSSAKSELMDLIPHPSKSKPNDTNQGIVLYVTTVTSSTTTKSLGVQLDHPLQFRMHMAAACAKTRFNARMIAWTCWKKSASPNALHHLINRANLPVFLWGSELWWTGHAHVIS